MAQQPYMGSGLLVPPLSEVTKSCAFVAVGDWPTGRATILSILMCPPDILHVGCSKKWTSPSETAHFLIVTQYQSKVLIVLCCAQRQRQRHCGSVLAQVHDYGLPSGIWNWVTFLLA